MPSSQISKTFKFDQFFANFFRSFGTSMAVRCASFFQVSRRNGDSQSLQICGKGHSLSIITLDIRVRLHVRGVGGHACLVIDNIGECKVKKRQKMACPKGESDKRLQGPIWEGAELLRRSISRTEDTVTDQPY